MADTYVHPPFHDRRDEGKESDPHERNHKISSNTNLRIVNRAIRTISKSINSMRISSHANLQRTRPMQVDDASSLLSSSLSLSSSSFVVMMWTMEMRLMKMNLRLLRSYTVILLRCSIILLRMTLLSNIFFSTQRDLSC